MHDDVMIHNGKHNDADRYATASIELQQMLGRPLNETRIKLTAGYMSSHLHLWLLSAGMIGVCTAAAAIFFHAIRPGVGALVMSILCIGAALWLGRRAKHLDGALKHVIDSLEGQAAAQALNFALDLPTSQVYRLRAACIIWPLLPWHDSQSEVSTLRAWLTDLPIQHRSAALGCAALHDHLRMAALLTELANPALDGLTSAACETRDAIEQRGHHDHIARGFFRVLCQYGMQQDDTEYRIAQSMIARGQDRDAEIMLTDLASISTKADVLFLLATTRQRLQGDAATVIDACLKFLDNAPEDSRRNKIWTILGDRYAEVGDIEQAIHAYGEATANGSQVAWLDAYRSGAWETLPQLHSHPDHVFPTVVAIDLEVDPLAGASPGDRIFEVGAVRFRGRTILAEYHSFIQRPFRPAKTIDPGLLDEAPSPDAVAEKLQRFIGDALICGHNLIDFDAVHLRGLGVTIRQDAMIDTLILARMLLPDRMHHNLGSLCHLLNIPLATDERHTALPDARATGMLLYTLGERLLNRSDALLSGIRALAEPGSSFDRAVLQPRGVGADRSLPWILDSAPSAPVTLPYQDENPASASMAQALSETGDWFVELVDTGAGYIRHLPEDQRVLVTVAAQSRLERALGQCRYADELFVLPAPSSLLCPERMRDLINAERDTQARLELFCLYQASHNHDATTLYPFRIPGNDERLARYRAMLASASCSNTPDHSAVCPGQKAARLASTSARILFATHAVFAQQVNPISTELIVIDDCDTLSTGLAEYAAVRVSQDDLSRAGQTGRTVAERLTTLLTAYADTYLPVPGYRERVQLDSVIRFAKSRSSESSSLELTSILDPLLQSGSTGKVLYQQITSLMEQAMIEPVSPELIHAHWSEFEFADGDGGARLAGWAICGISADLHDLFTDRYWLPYRRHIMCGPALQLGHSGTTFMERSLGLNTPLRIASDPPPVRELVLFSPEVMPPSSFMHRRTWILDAAAQIYHELRSDNAKLVLSLRDATGAACIGAACRHMRHSLGRQVLGLEPSWTTSRMIDRLSATGRSTLALVSPHARRTLIDIDIDTEISGPLRFLNQRDPLVAAQMRVFRSRYPAEGPFDAFLLPQALLELKARLSSSSRRHVLLESSLLARSYRDEALDVLRTCVNITEITHRRPLDADGKKFIETVSVELMQRGLPHESIVSDADLDLILRTLWNTYKFRKFEGTNFTQKDVIRNVLAGRDQLVVVATGGGKSLCFQLPAVILAEERMPKLTIVVSPLIALMKNQVDELNRKGIFNAILLNSTLSPAERQEHLRGLRRGDYSILYMAPEQIHSPGLRRAITEREVGLVAIDEAHCLSQWGHDFRTDYFMLKKWIDRRLVRQATRTFPILALTATARQSYEGGDKGSADKASTVKDITTKLGLINPITIFSSTYRQGLLFHVDRILPEISCQSCGRRVNSEPGWITCPHCGKRQRITEQDLRSAVEAAKQRRLISLFRDADPNGVQRRWSASGSQRQRGLVYCAYRRTTEELTEVLRKHFPELRVEAYHAGREGTIRDEVLRRFTSDGPNGIDVVVATNAFGMGIDVRKLGYVIHFDTPGTLEAYYQEAGRAGRDPYFDGTTDYALCTLLYHPSDLQKQQFLKRQQVIIPVDIEEVYDALRAWGGGKGVNGSAERQIQVTEADIAALAGVDEEQVTAILYYLECHTTAHGQSVLERGETANRVWHLQFQQGYADRIAQLPPSSTSQDLIHLFTVEGEFQLKEHIRTAIAVGDLKESLSVSYAQVEREILNLVQRKIVSYASDGRLRWTVSPLAAQDMLDATRRDIRSFLRHANQQNHDRLANSEVVYADLGNASVISVPPDRLAHFFFALSRDSIEPDRVFERFERAIRSTQPLRYEIQLWRARNGTTNDTIDRLFDKLRNVVQRLIQLRITTEWQPFDILQVEPDYTARQRLHQNLVLLHILGLIEYVGDPAMGRALSVTLHQPHLAADRLEIDLQSLRLKETYEKHKLKLLDHYAALADEVQRANEFESYFHASSPLIAQIDTPMRSNTTVQQRQVIMADRGIHLIEGPAGCGKTTALVEHIKYLVQHRHVPLEKIMVTTHYLSAVGRIDKQLEILRDDGAVALATTINSFGRRIFLKHRLMLLRPDGQPYYLSEPQLIKEDTKGDYESLRIVSEALTRVHAQKWSDIGWPEDLEHPNLAPQYRRSAATEEMCLRAINRFREYGIFPSLNTDRASISQALGASSSHGPLRQATDATYGVSELYAVYITFFELLGEKRLYSFDDQILFALVLLRTNEYLQREYSRSFEHVIIDELQDFTPAAAALFLAMSSKHQNVMAFGDTDQSIRPMDTSSAEVFERLTELDTCGRSHTLLTNFRSTQEILDLALAIRNHEERKKLGPLVADRGSIGVKPVNVRVLTTAPLPARKALEEMLDAAFAQLESLTDEQIGTVSLIVAKSPWRHQLEKVLISRGVAFSILGGKSLYQLRHVSNVLVYYRLISDPHRNDDAAQLLRFCVVPYLENRQIHTLQSIADSRHTALLTVLEEDDVLRQADVSIDQRHAITPHLAILKSLNPQSSSIHLERALRDLAHGPIEVLAQQPDRLEDVNDVLDEFRTASISDVVSAVERHKLFLDAHRDNIGLVLTSVDHAKSEEFDTVVIIGPNHLTNYSKLRLYVSVSRAKNRLYMLQDAQYTDRGPMTTISPRLWTNSVWRAETGDSSIAENEALPF